MCRAPSRPFHLELWFIGYKSWIVKIAAWMVECIPGPHKYHVASTERLFPFLPFEFDTIQFIFRSEQSVFLVFFSLGHFICPKWMKCLAECWISAYQEKAKNSSAVLLLLINEFHFNLRRPIFYYIKNTLCLLMWKQSLWSIFMRLIHCEWQWLVSVIWNVIT